MTGDMTHQSKSWLIAGAASIIALVWLLSPILTPFFLGLLIAYLGQPVVDRLSRTGRSRTTGVLFVFLMVTIILCGLLLLALPQLFSELADLIQRAPAIVDYLSERIEVRLGALLGAGALDAFDAKMLKDWMSDWGQIRRMLVAGGKELFASGAALFGALATAALTPVVAFYFMRDWPELIAGTRRLIPKSVLPRAGALASECDSILTGFFAGQFMVMLALATIYSVGLLALGVKGGLAIGVIAGLLSIVPYLGGVIGLTIGLLSALYQFQDWFHPSMVLLVFMVGQVIESTVLTPWLVGDRIGLHPVAVIFALMAGGQLFGLVGVLIALPVAAVIVVALKQVLSASSEFEFGES
ncbi:MAG: AI-2E family transporter, partial [Gammaproteobacteria bacterium]